MLIFPLKAGQKMKKHISLLGVALGANCIIATAILSGCEDSSDHKDKSSSSTNSVSTTAVATTNFDAMALAGVWHGKAGTSQINCTLDLSVTYAGDCPHSEDQLQGQLIWQNGDIRTIGYRCTKCGSSVHLEFYDPDAVHTNSAMIYTDQWNLTWDGSNSMRGLGTKYKEGDYNGSPSGQKYDVNLSR